MNETTLYRYPGIQPFTEEQKAIFFGRDDDRDRLMSLILLEKLTVLFGKSGYGKSSLLNAGIAPDLEKESRRGKRTYIPVFIRFHSSVGNESYNWFDWFSFQLAQKMQGTDQTEYENRNFLPRTLWGELKRRQTDPNQVFILIFDQFEEIFTYPKEQQEAFKQQLADLLYADIPEYLEYYEDFHSQEEVELMTLKLEAKAVISIRADRLSDLDQLKDKLPAILNKRYELRARTPGQAREALVNPAGLPDPDATIRFKSTVFSWQPDAIRKIIDELSHDKQGREVGVEAFQLQILAQNIENQIIQGKIPDRDADGIPDVATTDLPGIDSLYEDFYTNALKTLSGRERFVTRLLLENGLIFEDDKQRINLHEKLIARDYQVNAALIEKLIDLRLVRSEPSTSGGHNIELSHDSFITPILNVAQKRKIAQWRKRLTAVMVLAGVLGLCGLGAALFSRWDGHQAVITALKNEILTQKLDSIKVVQTKEQEAKSVALRYLNCVNNHDIPCVSSLMTDTLEQYYQAANLPRSKREKQENDYFRKHPEKSITQINDVTVSQKDSIYEVTINTDFLHPTKGKVQVIYRIKINEKLKMYYLRSYIATE
jgi:hypothetical protein